ncbi:MAG: Mrp/NBP35 family ATP-binding protein [Acidimicrobiales bacterium]
MPTDRELRDGPTDEELLAALTGVVDPELGEDLVSLGMVRSVSLDDRRAHVEIALTIAGCPLRTQLRNDVTRHLVALDGVDEVEVTTVEMDKDERARVMSTARRLAQRKAVATGFPSSTRVLAVVSGKGGVGKSSVTAALALALSRKGFNVGLLDADIWGFSIPRLLGVREPLAVRNKKMVPARVAAGDARLQVVSMGFLSNEEEAIMWRGLVLARAVQHFLEDVDWGDIDYLLVDMPPGTGDVQMALSRMLPRAEFLVVTTPSSAAAKVAQRAADMARKGHVRVAGVIENMSAFECENGHRHALFGSGGGAELARAIGVELLGSLPIDPALSAAGDAGAFAQLDQSSPSGRVFDEIAARLSTDIAPVVEMSGCSARLVERVEERLSRPAS